MGSAANPGRIGTTSAQEKAAEEEAARKKAAQDALYGANGPGQREVNNQGDGGWFGGPVGTITKSALSAPGDLIAHVGGAGIDAVQGDWSGAGKNIVSAGRDAANVASGGTASLAIGSTEDPTGGLIKPVIGAGKAIGGAVTGAVDKLGHAIGGLAGGPAPDPATTGDLAAARASTADLANQYKNAATRPAPTLAAPTLGPAAQVAPTTVGPAAQVTPVTVAPAATVGGAPQISAGRVTASQVAQTPGAVAAPVVAATVDKHDQAQFRGDQRDLVAQLKDAAAGRVPSAAELQAKRSSEDAIASQAALAGTVHGYGALAATRQAGRNVAALQQKGNLDASMVRAKEQADARGLLQNALDSGRGQDIGLASTEAGFKQQANVTGAQLKTDVSKQTAGIAADRATKQAELDTGAATTTAGMALDAAKANQGATVTTSLADQAAQNRMKELQTQIDAQRGLATAEQQNELTKLQAQLASSENQFNAGQTNDLNKTAAQLKLQADVSQMDAELKARGLDDAQRQSLIDAYIKQQGQVLDYDKSKMLIDANTAAANKELLVKGATGLIGGFGQALALSDQRAKRDIKKVSAAAVSRLAKVVSEPKSWRYKGEHDDGHEHFGEMAQKLEKDPLGKKLVHQGDDGLKRVDYQGLTALVLAAALKGRKAARR